MLGAEPVVCDVCDRTALEGASSPIVLDPLAHGHLVRNDNGNLRNVCRAPRMELSMELSGQGRRERVALLVRASGVR